MSGPWGRVARRKGGRDKGERQEYRAMLRARPPLRNSGDSRNGQGRAEEKRKNNENKKRKRKRKKTGRRARRKRRVTIPVEGDGTRQ